MKTTSISLFVFLFMLTPWLAGAQNFEKSFQAYWGSTDWKFEFHRDGTYKRTSDGHYGNTVVEGRYTVKKDSIELTGYENSQGTINRFYVLDKDSMLIDLSLRYDYLPDTNLVYMSSVRNIKYPQAAASTPTQKADMQTTLALILNADEVKAYIPFDHITDGTLPVVPYFELNESAALNLTAGKLKVVFVPEEKITSAFFLKVEDINQNAETIEFSLQSSQGVSWLVYCKKVNGRWEIEQIIPWGQ